MIDGEIDSRIEKIAEGLRELGYTVKVVSKILGTYDEKYILLKSIRFKSVRKTLKMMERKQDENPPDKKYILLYYRIHQVWSTNHYPAISFEYADKQSIGMTDIGE